MLQGISAGVPFVLISVFIHILSTAPVRRIKVCNPVGFSLKPERL
jgi:hypothetical protein